MNAAICAYRTALVDPKGKPKPHRFTVKHWVGDSVTVRCSGCWTTKAAAIARVGAETDAQYRGALDALAEYDRTGHIQVRRSASAGPSSGTEGPGSSPPDDDGPLAPPKPTSTSHLPSHPLAAPPTDPRGG